MKFISSSFPRSNFLQSILITMPLPNVYADLGAIGIVIRNYILVRMTPQSGIHSISRLTYDYVNGAQYCNHNVCAFNYLSNNACYCRI